MTKVCDVCLRRIRLLTDGALRSHRIGARKRRCAGSYTYRFIWNTMMRATSTTAERK